MLGTGYGECKLKSMATKDYRGRGGVLIDGFLLVDAPKDIHETAKWLGYDSMFEGVTDILISHSHPGHFSAEAISKIAKKRRVRLFASREVLRLVEENPNIEKYEICSFVQFALGKYKVLPLPSNHKTNILTEECFNFLIYSDKSLLYALDGGWINQRAFNLLDNVELDAIICDAALESLPPSEKNLYHNDVHTLGRIKEIFTGRGIVNDRTKIILSHIPTDKKRQIHDELTAIAKEYGMVVAYDGYFFAI